MGSFRQCFYDRMQTGGAHAYEFFSFPGYGIGEGGVAGRAIEGMLTTAAFMA